MKGLLPFAALCLLPPALALRPQEGWPSVPVRRVLRHRPPEPTGPSLQRLVFDLQRLERDFRRISGLRRAREAPPPRRREPRLRRDAARLLPSLGLDEPAPSPLSAIDRLQTEADLCQHGLDLVALSRPPPPRQQPLPSRVAVPSAHTHGVPVGHPGPPHHAHRHRDLLGRHPAREGHVRDRASGPHPAPRRVPGRPEQRLPAEQLDVGYDGAHQHEPVADRTLTARPSRPATASPRARAPSAARGPRRRPSSRRARRAGGWTPSGVAPLASPGAARASESSAPAP